MFDQQGQQPQWPPQQLQQLEQPQTWYPPNSGWPPSHPVSPPTRQFKNPLAMPLSYTEQQYDQTQWGQQTLQYYRQSQQPQWRLIQQPPIYPQLSFSQRLKMFAPRPKPRPKRKPWFILGIVATLLLFAGIGGTFVLRSNSTPQRAAQIAITSSDTQPAQSGQHTATQPLLAATPIPTQAQSLQSGQHTATQPLLAATPTPAQAQSLNWTITHTFTGNGEKQTSTFMVGNTWKLIWTCNPATILGGAGIMIVNVFSANGSFELGAINAICEVGHTTGYTISHQGGNIYLDITGDGNWTVQIQEPRAAQ